MNDIEEVNAAIEKIDKLIGDLCYCKSELFDLVNTKPEDVNYCPLCGKDDLKFVYVCQGSTERAKFCPHCGKKVRD